MVVAVDVVVLIVVVQSGDVVLAIVVVRVKSPTSLICFFIFRFFYHYLEPVGATHIKQAPHSLKLWSSCSRE